MVLAIPAYSLFLAYNVVFLVLTYVVPVATMAVTYTRMSVVLWGSRCIGEFTEHQQNALRSKQKVVKMLFTVVVLFTVSWLPYHIYFIYVFHHPKVAYVDYIQHVYLAMYWLAMSHAMYNPIVYYFMNKSLYIPSPQHVATHNTALHAYTDKYQAKIN
ncbi:tachykinin-like peptides receptor 86C [Ixodes scapularis]|uniref:tachykinin-like peptides receptor 86C n=1 Tax=Ixodes scapularis TaxID=6945 RepID=UPI001C391FBF|nr:tachykinin-like peptides receptor 86C [Ixodes scapularis]